MPLAASLSRDCCWLLARINDLRPLKMIGSTLELCQLLVAELRRQESALTVGDDDGGIPLNGLVCDGPSQVDSEQDRVLVAPERVEGGLEKHWEASVWAINQCQSSDVRPVLSQLLSASASG